jgi:HEXXH motif-containing protein
VSVLRGSALAAVAEKQYEQWLLVRLLGLLDAQRQSLAILDGLRVDQILAGGSPFFWMNVHRLLTSDAGGAAIRGASINYLICQAFDSYFSCLGDGQEVRAEIDESGPILLPRLQIRFQAKKGFVRLQKRNQNGILIDLDGRRISFDVTDVPAKYRLSSMAIRSGHSTRLLPVAHQSLFEQAYIDAITRDVNAGALAAMIADALDLICAVDPPIGDRIRSNVGWYVPIGTDSPEVHRSFSAANLAGVVFLSEATDILRLAEAIVHEFHHNELYAYSHVAPIIKPGSGELYYSPWREDARPLDGLIHAIFVFAGVCDFYRHVERRGGPRPDSARLRERRSQRIHQLEIGLAQVSEAHLTDAGAALIASLRNRVAEHKRDLSVDTAAPLSLERHLRVWLEVHPELANEVHVPPAW